MTTNENPMDKHALKPDQSALAHSIIHAFFPGYGILPLPHERDDKAMRTFWDYQTGWSLDARIESFPQRKDWYLKNCNWDVRPTELDFIKYERKKIEEMENLIWALPEQYYLSCVLREYCAFLDGVESEIKAGPSPNKKSSPESLIVLVGMLLCIEDSGIAKCRSDYQLAKHIENNYLYDTDKPINNCAQIISRYRNCEHDNEKIETVMKNYPFKIRTIDDKKIG